MLTSTACGGGPDETLVGCRMEPVKPLPCFGAANLLEYVLVLASIASTASTGPAIVRRRLPESRASALVSNTSRSRQCRIPDAPMFASTRGKVPTHIHRHIGMYLPSSLVQAAARRGLAAGWAGAWWPRLATCSRKCPIRLYYLRYENKNQLATTRCAQRRAGGSAVHECDR